MFRIPKDQYSRLGQWMHERFIDRLASYLQEEYFARGVKRVLCEDSVAGYRDLAKRLVAEGVGLGITRVGDLTPCCLLLICDQPELQQSNLSNWIWAILTAVEYPAESRMNAIHSMLPAGMKEMIYR